MAFKSQPTVTRPANTTAYTAGDVVGGVITFDGLGNKSGHILVTSCDLRIHVSAIPSGMTSFTLHLYDATPGSAYADNAAWDLPSGDRANYLGYIDLGAPADKGSTLYAQVDQVEKHIRMPGDAGADIFGYLVTNGAFTPAGNSEVYVPSISAIPL
jgi:hypothetical protein